MILVDIISVNKLNSIIDQYWYNYEKNIHLFINIYLFHLMR